ncbi:uncharacterized protein A4U43_C04F24760 [Asparagus officinalis]|uniref:POX domain-containing protein n=1 Tax=Asparagus officinalis TaxID=4686 RepID=A0A5P1F670_ASPOF|nr:uncharacterized protein A4U43_C04F24760 [Asparagus officinalis]
MAHESAYGFNCFSSAAQSSPSLQGFDAGHHGLFELQAGMEMLGIPKAEGNFVEYPSPWQQQNRMLAENQGLSLSLPRHQQNYQQEQQMSMTDARFYQTYQLKNSLYLIPAQELLSEFCNLEGVSNNQRERKLKSKEGESSSRNQSSIFSMDALELQKLKAKLLFYALARG